VSLAWDRFAENPTSMRSATITIVVATVGVVIAAAVAMWLLDAQEYPDLGQALWWSIQTVTTVGYGDTTPADPNGRLVAVVVMLIAVAGIGVFTALITSVFVEARQRAARTQQDTRDQARWGDLEAALAEQAARLDRIERWLRAGGAVGSPPSTEAVGAPVDEPRPSQ
jgi:voltage-gated potassium channel